MAYIITQSALPDGYAGSICLIPTDYGGWVQAGLTAKIRTPDFYSYMQERFRGRLISLVIGYDFGRLRDKVKEGRRAVSAEDRTQSK